MGMNEDDGPRELLAFDLERARPHLVALLSAEERGVSRSDLSKHLQDLETLLDDYQEEPYLLDASLEHLTTPAAHRLRDFLCSPGHVDVSDVGIHCLTHWLYHLMKVRGHKAIARFFPHEVTDLDHLLVIFRNEPHVLEEPESWRMRFVLLIWLSLACLLPIDLSRWDRAGAHEPTALYLFDLGRRYIDVPGKEGDAAAIMLGKLLVRKDTASSLLPMAIEHLATALRDVSANAFTAPGLLHALCEAVKVGTRLIVVPFLPELYELLALCDGAAAAALQRNPLVRRYRAKLAGRLALLYLPMRRHQGRRPVQRLALGSGDSSPENTVDQGEPDELVVAEQVEVLAQDLLDALDDVDGAVRFTAAKHLARIVAALPASPAEQIISVILLRFSDGVITMPSGHEDLSNVSDAKWQGYCLALAEMARRNAISENALPQLVPLLLRALHLDRRKGSRIIGSSVRDAAAYVIWALARSSDPDMLRPSITQLAPALVVVACYDREIRIRRAASAAFQELVGRTSAVPDGIALLRAIDFYNCGIKRTAFLVSAKQVARFDAYRPVLFRQLMETTLKHYDAELRELGSQSLRDMVTIDPALVQRAVAGLQDRLQTSDTACLHGTLLGLSKIAQFTDSRARSRIFEWLSDVPPKMLTGSLSILVIEAACHMLRANVLNTTDFSHVALRPSPLLTAAGKKASLACHEAAAGALGALSQKMDVAPEVKRLITQGLHASMPTIQESSATILGAIDYNGPTQQSFEHVIRALLTFVNTATSKGAATIEGRRRGLDSLTRILVSAGTSRRVAFAPMLVSLLSAGLEDYTSDQRGEVGSVIRMVSMTSLVTLRQLEAGLITDETWRTTISACFRMSVEQIDAVRVSALENLARVLQQARHRVCPIRLFVDEVMGGEMRELHFVLAKALAHFEALSGDLRIAVLEGCSYSIGMSAKGTISPAARKLVVWASSLPTEGRVSKKQLILDLCDIFATVPRLFVSVIQLMTFLLRSGVLADLLQLDRHLHIVDRFGLLMREVESVTASSRALSLADFAVAILEDPTLRPYFIWTLEPLLSHRLRLIREHVSEELFARSLVGDQPAAENLLLTTPWGSLDVASEAAHHMVQLLIVH